MNALAAIKASEIQTARPETTDWIAEIGEGAGPIRDEEALLLSAALRVTLLLRPAALIIWPD